MNWLQKKTKGFSRNAINSCEPPFPDLELMLPLQLREDAVGDFSISLKNQEREKIEFIFEEEDKRWYNSNYQNQEPNEEEDYQLAFNSRIPYQPPYHNQNSDSDESGVASHFTSSDLDEDIMMMTYIDKRNFTISLWEDISIDEESKAFTVLIGELSVEDLEVL
jgi:hypothetical protein